MKRIALLAIIFVSVVVFGLLGFDNVWAEDVNFTVTSYVTKMESIPVPDDKGHILLLGERRGVAVFSDNNVAAYHTRFICNLNKMHGPCDGYTDLTYPDGSKTIVSYKLTVGVPPGKKVPTLEGKGDYIKGTGKFQGIAGNISFKGYYITPYGEETKGDMIINVSGSYTLPPK